MDGERVETVGLTNRRVVAVDGGTATGKGRLIAELSQAMRLKGIPVVHLSTGSLYRAVAYVAIQDVQSRMSKRELARQSALETALARVRKMSADTLLELARERRIEMHGGVVWLDGEPTGEDSVLKAPGSGTGSAIVSVPVPVREFVNVTARRQVNEFDGYVLMDGRDTTHIVVPDAPLKLLLTVAPAIAAKRSIEHTEAEIRARDESDMRKSYGALRPAHDPGDGVRVIATDGHSPESLRDLVYNLMRKVFHDLPKL